MAMNNIDGEQKMDDSVIFVEEWNFEGQYRADERLQNLMTMFPNEDLEVLKEKAE